MSYLEYKELAIVAPTASGKTALSIGLAHKLNAVILSLDSLSVYKQIDIASAKPSITERDGIVHFGIDKVLPNENFDVVEFIQEYKNAKQYAIENGKNLIIVGGTGFYLKSMIDGLSKSPQLSKQEENEVSTRMVNLEDSYSMLLDLDSNFMSKIAQTDKYRIEKALQVYISSGLKPSEYFVNNQPKPIIKHIDIFEIVTDVDKLRERIKLRTKMMIDGGIIDEVIFLEKEYTRKPNAMRSIGIVETLDYLDGRIDKKELEEQIYVHTAQLAKRQRTFNKSQFKNVYKNNLVNLEKNILSVV